MFVEEAMTVVGASLVKEAGISALSADHFNLRSAMSSHLFIKNSNEKSVSHH